jgi:hypothetical protein
VGSNQARSPSGGQRVDVVGELVGEQGSNDLRGAVEPLRLAEQAAAALVPAN